MKNKKVNYYRFPLIYETLGIPVFTYKAIKRLVKKEKIKDSLDIIIYDSKRDAKKTPVNTFSPSYIQHMRDEYQAQDDFFSGYFKSEAIKDFSFEEKIKYCLEKYKVESRKISSATNSLILEGDFLVGAKKTLILYFFFQQNKLDIDSPTPEEDKILMQINNIVVNVNQQSVKHVVRNSVANKIDNSVINNYTEYTPTINNYNEYIYEDRDERKNKENQLDTENIVKEITLSSLFKKEDYHRIFHEVLSYEEILPDNGAFKRGNKSIVAFILLKLQSKRIIQQATNAKELSQTTANAFGDSISETVFSKVRKEGVGNNEGIARSILNSICEEIEKVC